MQRVGSGLTLGLTAPLVGIGALAVDAAADFETLNATLDTVFKGNEAAAKAAFDQITEFTSKTPFQLEEVAGGFIKLKNLGLDPGIDSLRSYGNTASALGKTLDQFIEAVADASVNEFERLKEFGIKAKQQGDDVAFTFQGVTTVVAKNAEEIQAYLQDIGNTTFAGGIEKQANTFKGVISTLKDNFKLLLADFGQPILDILKPLSQTVSDLATRFRELSPETKKFVVLLGGAAAAVGPLLALAGTILPAIGTGLTLLSGPIGLVVAGLTAIGVVIYKNWEPIKEVLIEIANYFIDLYNESTVFRVAVEGVKTTFQNLYQVGKFVFDALGTVISTVANNIKTSFQGLGDLVKAILTGDIQQIPVILAAGFKAGVKDAKGLIAGLDEDFQNLKAGITNNIQEGVNNALRGKKYELLGSNVDTDSVEKKVSDAVIAGLKEGGKVGTPDLTPQVSKVGVALETSDVVDPLEGVANKIDASAGIITTRIAEVRESMTALQEASTEVGLAVGDAFANMTGRFVDSLDLANDGFEGFVKNLAQTVTKLIAMALSQSIAQAISGATASGASTGPAAVFTTPAFIATAISGVLAAFAAIPKFATGGIVGGNKYFGDMNLARVNSGELILNIAQQKNLASALGGSTTVTLQPSMRYEGDGFRIMLNRTDTKRNKRT